MTRVVVSFVCLALLAQSAMATSVFNKYWRDKYLDREKVSDEFYRTGRRAGCYVCHIKGHPDKKEARNEYGKAVKKYLDKEDFPRDWVKENPEKAEMMILEGFKKANEHESVDGKKFGEKLKAEELPATDWEYEEDE
jgi:hypothetical protein